jgi:hypothetical protein
VSHPAFIYAAYLLLLCRLSDDFGFGRTMLVINDQFPGPLIECNEVNFLRNYALLICAAAKSFFKEKKN